MVEDSLDMLIVERRVELARDEREVDVSAGVSAIVCTLSMRTGYGVK